MILSEVCLLAMFEAVFHQIYLFKKNEKIGFLTYFKMKTVFDDDGSCQLGFLFL